MISVKYQNQIVTTLNPYFKENDSLLKARGKDLAKISENTSLKKEKQPVAKVSETKKTASVKTQTAKSEVRKTEKKTTAAKQKTKAK